HRPPERRPLLAHPPQPLGPRHRFDLAAISEELHGRDEQRTDRRPGLHPRRRLQEVLQRLRPDLNPGPSSTGPETRTDGVAGLLWREAGNGARPETETFQIRGCRMPRVVFNPVAPRDPHSYGRRVTTLRRIGPPPPRPQRTA